MNVVGAIVSFCFDLSLIMLINDLFIGLWILESFWGRFIDFLWENGKESMVLRW